MLGAVFAGVGSVTVTVKVAGATLKVPAVVFEVWVKLMVAVPTPWGVTVRALVSPQLPKVTELGLTVATAALLELTENDAVVLPVKLQPFLPSPLRSTM